jgi:hypothetical protein
VEPEKHGDDSTFRCQRYANGAAFDPSAVCICLYNRWPVSCRCDYPEGAWYYDVNPRLDTFERKSKDYVYKGPTTVYRPNHLADSINNLPALGEKCDIRLNGWLFSAPCGQSFSWRELRERAPTWDDRSKDTKKRKRKHERSFAEKYILKQLPPKSEGPPGPRHYPGDPDEHDGKNPFYPTAQELQEIMDDPGQSICWDSKAAFDKHVDAPKPAMERLVKEHCAGMTAIPQVDINAMLMDNLGWHRVAVSARDGTYVQSQFRLTHRNGQAAPFSEMQCKKVFWNVVNFCSRRGSWGSATAIRNATLIAEVETIVGDSTPSNPSLPSGPQLPGNNNLPHTPDPKFLPSGCGPRLAPDPKNPGKFVYIC